jgi:hypothetical protein
MRIVIHGGMHKTGTTSLQFLMAENRAFLREFGIEYPNLGAIQHGKLLNIRRGDWNPTALRRCIETARATGANLLFLSAEAVSTLSAEQFFRINQACRGHELFLVFCFRHWLGYLPSRWTQYCKARDSQTFDQYLAMITDPIIRHPDWHFDAILDQAIEGGCFQIAAVSYDNAKDTDAGVLGEILRAAGLGGGLLETLLQQSRIRNERGDWRIHQLIRLLNGVIADRIGRSQNSQCRAIGHHRQGEGRFLLMARIEEIEPDVREALIMAVGRYETTRRFEDYPGLAECERRLSEVHGHVFRNRIGGRIFDRVQPSEFSYADIDWQSFARENHGLVDRAVEALLPNMFPPDSQAQKNH